MITFLIGENAFEVERAVGEIIAGFDGNAEKVDGSTLQLAQLPDTLMGVSLFATARLVILRNLSDNREIWPVFGDWLSKVSDDIHLVVIESKPDKRTVTYKALKKMATVKEFLPWTDRDTFVAEKWVIEEAKKQGYELDKKCAQLLVQRVGMDQWQLFHAVSKLASVDNVTVDIIKDVIEANPIDNVFNLFETAIKGDMVELKRLIESLKQTQDVYQLSGLLFGQAFQLMAIVMAEDSDDVAKDFGIHPYVVSKLTSIAKKLGKSGVSAIIEALAEADSDMKSSAIEPWLLVERALMKIANI